MRYVHFKSLTWWAGVAMITLGLARIFAGDTPQLGALSEALVLITGGAGSSPAMMIAAGFGFIGLRDKLARMALQPREPGYGDGQ